MTNDLLNYRIELERAERNLTEHDEQCERELTALRSRQAQEKRSLRAKVTEVKTLIAELS